MAVAAMACDGTPTISPYENGGKPGGGFVYKPASSSGSTKGGDGLSGLDVPICGFTRYEVGQEPVHILMLLDRSTTMAGKWADLTTSMVDIVKETALDMRWGIKSYPTYPTSGCGVRDGVDINFTTPGEMLGAQLASMRPATSFGTPMQLAIRKGAAHLKSLQLKAPAFLLLVTDGMPNCYENVPEATDAAGTANAVRDAADMGIPTIVIGYGANKASAGTLSELAKLGGMAVFPVKTGGAHYYEVADKAQFFDTLSKVSKAVSDCTFPLETIPPAPELVQVLIEGVPIPRDTNRMDGWDYTPNMHSIVVHGPACDALKTTTISLKVNVLVGCAVKVVE